MSLTTNAPEFVRKLALYAQSEFMSLSERIPNPFSSVRSRLPEAMRTALSALQQQGFALLPRYFPQEVIEPVADAARDVFSDPKTEVLVDGKPYYRLIKDPFVAIPGLLPLALDSGLRAIGEAYFGRRVVLAEASLEQLPPFFTDSGAYRWHFDARGKQLKAMILLSDVGPDGQHFSYILGSHGFRSFAERQNSRVSEAQVDRLGRARIVDGVGPAGSVVLFDTSGVHKGTRKPTCSRENLTLNIKVANRFLYPVPIAQDAAAKLTADERAFLRA